MFKVMIVDDDSAIRTILKKMIERQEGFEVVSDCGEFSTALLDFSKYKPEIVFMDVDLLGESGMDCAKIMTEMDPRVKIIFATAHSEYMANAFEIYAFDYLVKPFNMERIKKTLSRIRSFSGEKKPEQMEMPQVHSNGKLLIKGKEQVTFVDVASIIMVERVDGSTVITTTEGEYHTSIPLSNIEEKLDPGEFMRCHKSYIIRISHITMLEVYGRWTYTVKLKGTDRTALMTAQKYNELKSRYGL